MSKEKIAFVVHRYGKDICGGAEYLCRVLAEHMKKNFDVDVLTSCAMDGISWDNYFNEGIEVINDVRIHRFRVEKSKNNSRFSELTDKLRNNDDAAEDEWICEAGPYCPSCIQYLKEHGMEYKAVIFISYNFYMTIMGLKLGLKNSIFMPTAHDDANLHMPLYKKVFESAYAYLYNSIEERDLIYETFKTQDKPSRLTCVGIDEPDWDDGGFPERFSEYKDNYILYVGRVSMGKNVSELNRFFTEYKKRNPSDLKMIVAGKIDDEMNMKFSNDILYAGFVTDMERNELIRNAKLLVMPSKYESLSLVILESMIARRPVLVNGNCEVLKGQCIRSNAGLYYTDYFEFEYELNFMLNNKEEYSQMCENGYDFVKNNYNWDKVIENITDLIKRIGE
jgi:glycosyltransferase involved in cell wall biosynthesis